MSARFFIWAIRSARKSMFPPAEVLPSLHCQRQGRAVYREAITVDYSEGAVIEVPQHDGSIIKLRKLDATYDSSDKVGAMAAIARAAEKGEVLTGLLYLAPDAEDLHAHLNTYEAAFNKLGEKDLCPGSAMLEKINSGLR